MVKDIFVSGRVCLKGEHSDWASTCLSNQKNQYHGYAILHGTHQGIYSTVELSDDTNLNDYVINHIDDDFFVVCYKSNTFSNGVVKVDIFNHQNLQKIIDQFKNGKTDRNHQIFSYVYGTLYALMNIYEKKVKQKVDFLRKSQNKHFTSILIHNHKTTLPTKKGLSSSAAVCVTIVRCLNKCLKLELSIEEEMNVAYLGERSIGSKCGRLDQVCAYGSVLILATFFPDGKKEPVIEPIDVSDKQNKFYFVIVDLNGEKDTEKILNDLNNGIEGIVPDSLGDQNCEEYLNRCRMAQNFLWKENKDIVFEALDCLKRGDAEKFGCLLKVAQSKYDECLVPLCKEQLKAPKLHSVLNYNAIQNDIYGGKWNGAGGDGSCILLCKDEQSHNKVIEILNKEMNVTCIPMIL